MEAKVVVLAEIEVDVSVGRGGDLSCETIRKVKELTGGKVIQIKSVK